MYHPQNDGLVEQLNNTLKFMICKFSHEHEGNWDRWLARLLFAGGLHGVFSLWVAVPQKASGGFGPS